MLVAYGCDLDSSKYPVCRTLIKMALIVLSSAGLVDVCHSKWKCLSSL